MAGVEAPRKGVCPQMQRYLRLVAGLVQAVLLLFANPALAAPTHIAAQLLVEGPALPGDEVTLAVRMRPEQGWHGYWQNPGDAGQGMTLKAWLGGSEQPLGALRYPVPETLLIAGLMNHVYEHEYAVLTSLRVPRQTPPGTILPLRVEAQWLACTDEICVPESGTLTAQITVGARGAPDGQFDKWRAALPAPLGAQARFASAGGRYRIGIPLPASVRLDAPHLFVSDASVVDYAAPQVFTRQGDLLVVELPPAKFAPVTPQTLSGVLRLSRTGDGVELTAVPGSVPAGGTPVAGGAAPVRPQGSFALLVAMALAGGLLLNVMPCVFPILSLKALSLARAGESEAQARAEGLAYTAGVVLACLGLGVLLLALRAAGEEVGWAFQLQEPLVVAALLLLAAAITANLLGVFEFSVPGFASEGSPQGAFATGLLAAFAATPCTGPFMAAAMGAALLLPAAQALALFAALGLGLALPFLALAYIPALRRRLPRPGAWMGRFRTIMAVPMGLTAIALVWLASRLAGSAFAFAASLLVIVMLSALVVLGRRQRHGLAGGWPVMLALAMVPVLGAIGLPGMVREASAAAAGILPTKPFSEAALAEARAKGAPVFVYMTADWCLTCKVNEAAAIEREDTAAAFKAAGVTVLRGDWTRRDPAITRYLTAQGAAGVPLYMWYPAGDAPPRQLPQVLTPAMLAQLAEGGD